MTDDATTEHSRCPSCNRRSKHVGAVTLQAVLKRQFADRFADSKANWQFCDATDCDVVYFDGAGDTTFTKSQLRVAVGVKESTGDRPLCYCFGHSIASIKSEFRTKGHCDALDDIRSKMKHLGCHCELKNPSGSCCLGSVAEGITVAKTELRMREAVPSALGRLGDQRQTIANTGTLLSAVMASACCWLPLVLLAVGVSGVGIAAILEAYRPYLMVVTFGFLGTAFYFAYRPKKPTASSGHDCCAADEVEGRRGGRRGVPMNMMGLNKGMLWLVTALAVVLLFFPSYLGAFLSDGDGATVSPGMNRISVEVQGMTCEGCSAVVAESLRGVSGVVGVKVDHETGRALIGTEAWCEVSGEAILAAIESSGFDARIVASETHPHSE